MGEGAPVTFTQSLGRGLQKRAEILGGLGEKFKTVLWEDAESQRKIPLNLGPAICVLASKRD